MYSSHHAAVSLAITATAYGIGGAPAVALALPVAFLSHDVLDRVGEAAYGSSFPPSKQTVLWEGVPFLIFVVAAIVSGVWWLFATAWIAGMGMDLIDKGRYLAFGEGPIFPCHKRQPNLRLSLDDTKNTAMLSAMSYIAIALILAG